MTKDAKNAVDPSSADEPDEARPVWEKFDLLKEEFDQVVDVFRILLEWDRELAEKSQKSIGQK